MNEAATDKPISTWDEDKLERQGLIENLTKSLLEEYQIDGTKSRRASGTVIGLTGEWGSGKSSVLNLLSERLSKLSGVIVVNFNPWLFRGPDHLMVAFFNEVSTSLVNSPIDQFRELRAMFDRYRNGIVSAASLGADVASPGSGTLVKVFNALIPRRKAVSIEKTRVEIEGKIRAHKIAVVVLIDELDRVEDEEVRAVARLIKAVGNIAGISYVVAYDPNRVIRALNRGGSDNSSADGEAYIEKIIQLPVPLRPLLDYQIQEMLAQVLERRGYILDPDDAEVHAFLHILSQSLSTPRDVKRVVSCFSAIEPMVHGEVSQIDVLGYSYLLIKAPTIHMALASNINCVVDDPGELEQFRQMASRESTLETTFGNISPKHANILRYLFPRFSSEQDSLQFTGDKIRKRRNLQRLVYLGNPPHEISRKEIDEVWMLPAEHSSEKLRQIFSGPKSRKFFDRFCDLFPTLSSENDLVFWPSLSNALVRATEGVQVAEPHWAVVDDLDDLLRTSSARNTEAMKRGRKIIDILIACGDLSIVPVILRSHLYRYGLSNTEITPRDNVPSILNSNETLEILSQQIPKYKEAIISGFATDRLISAHIFYLLLNTNSYDSSLAKSMTSTTQRPQKDCLICVIGRETLSNMFDFNAVHKYLDDFKNSENFSQADPWVQNAVKRLSECFLGRW